MAADAEEVVLADRVVVAAELFEAVVVGLVERVAVTDLVEEPVAVVDGVPFSFRVGCEVPVAVLVPATDFEEVVEAL